MNIVLFEPEMPMNTGNIGRTCVATNTRLHLIEPLGFKLNEKAVKRAGLDYWDKLDVTVYSDFQDFLDRNPGAKIYMATTKAPKTYTDVEYEPDCYIMFGKESAGIPEEILVDAMGLRAFTLFKQKKMAIFFIFSMLSVFFAVSFSEVCLLPFRVCRLRSN